MHGARRNVETESKLKQKRPRPWLEEVAHRSRIPEPRPTGRLKKHANNAQKCRSYRERRNSVAVTRNTPSQVIENEQLAAAKNGSHVVGLIPETGGALETRLIAENRSLASGSGDMSFIFKTHFCFCILKNCPLCTILRSD